MRAFSTPCLRKASIGITIEGLANGSSFHYLHTKMKVPIRDMQYESQAVVSTAKIIVNGEDNNAVASTEHFAQYHSVLGPYTGRLRCIPRRVSTPCDTFNSV